MPGYKGHLSAGCVWFAIAYYLLTMTHIIIPTHIFPVVGWLLCTLAGSLFPDIDIKSKGQAYFYWLILGLCVYCIVCDKMMALSCIAIMATVPMLVKHRGLFHSIYFLGALFISSYYIGIAYMPECQLTIFTHILFFALGTISHLWLDLGLLRMLRW